MYCHAQGDHTVNSMVANSIKTKQKDFLSRVLYLTEHCTGVMEGGSPASRSWSHFLPFPGVLSQPCGRGAGCPSERDMLSPLPSSSPRCHTKSRLFLTVSPLWPSDPNTTLQLPRICLQAKQEAGAFFPNHSVISRAYSTDSSHHL